MNALLILNILNVVLLLFGNAKLITGITLFVHFRVFFFLGAAYLIASFSLRVGHSIAFQFFDSNAIVTWPSIQ